MKVLVISKTGKILPLAYEIMEEGNQVRLFRMPDGIKTTGDGILDIVDEWRSSVPWSDLVLVEAPGLIPEGALRAMGRPYIGCSELGARLETGYEYQREAFTTAGLRMPETYDIEGPDEIQQMIDNWRNPGYRLLLGDHSFDMVTEGQLNWVHKAVKLEWPEIFQRIVPGTRLVHEGWFNGREWVSPFLRLYYEHQSISEGNLIGDSAIGCTAHGVGEDDLTAHSITPVGEFLAYHSYRGPVSISLVVTENGVYCTSIRCGFNYNAIPLMLEGMLEPVADFLFEVAQGTRDFMELGSDLIGAVEVDYGSQNPEMFHYFPVDNLTEVTAKHFRFQDVMVDPEEPMIYRMAGETGILGHATAFGPQTYILRRRLALTVRSLKIPYVSFRNTIGGYYDRARKNLAGAGMSYV